jgi:hypothetical protein
MSERNRPKYSFSQGIRKDEFLSAAVQSERSDLGDEVVGAWFGRFDANSTREGRIAPHRTKESGACSELPEVSQPGGVREP